MASDAHAHPYYLAIKDPNAEAARIRQKIHCAASAFAKDEFLFNEAQKQKNTSAQTALCFAVHPQLPSHQNSQKLPEEAMLFLEELAQKKRIHAVGETGFDLYNKHFKDTEKIQHILFEHHLQTALAFDLPIVLHIRKAMHKVYEYTKQLARLPAVVFHSYQGTAEDAKSILRRGINACFSFGLPLASNHKHAIQCCISLEADRLLCETDAPYQNLRGTDFSSYNDITVVIKTIAALRQSSIAEIENITDQNWKKIFGTTL